ncbi:MAG: Uma2 family endonuclease [Snowella sp.]|nr:Uma2 family endonuclease [Snowella sp.]
MVVTAPHPKKFTTEEYYKMAESGILKDGDRVELIKGEIIEMSPVGFRHAACVNKLNQIVTVQRV